MGPAIDPALAFDVIIPALVKKVIYFFSVTHKIESCMMLAG